MSAKIKHVAILTDNYPRLANFYETLFGMTKSKSAVEHGPPGSRVGGLEAPSGAVSLSDGYIGMAIIGRETGYSAGLDHFGIVVDDIEIFSTRLRQCYPAVKLLKRVSNRPFASFSCHDPEGNVYDVSQAGMANVKGTYADADSERLRRIHHIKLRAIHPSALAKFYVDMFQFREEEKASEDPNFYLSDGKVRLVIARWSIMDYDGTSVAKPTLEHIGFQVENVEAVKRDLQSNGFTVESFDEVKRNLDAMNANPQTPKRAIEWALEREAMLQHCSGCRYGNYHFSDPDGIFIDVLEN
jgi:catechol 2,3-dioxygenase-like lactoylglutathione lyase family enzyme